MNIYAIQLPDGSIAMSGPYVLATENEAQADRMAHARDGTVLTFTAHGGSGEVAYPENYAGPFVHGVCNQSPPTSAREAEVEAVVDELQDLAGYSFNVECCNSTFPIGQLRRVCKQAAALLTRSPARVGGEGMVAVDRFSLETLAHKFERAGGPWKIAERGIPLGAMSWASNVENSLTAITAALAQQASGMETNNG